MKNFIKNELSGWRTGEVLWICISVAIIVVISVVLGDSAMGIISSTTGVMYTLLAGKGKLSAYFFGLINSVLYAIISYHAAYYGETMLNALYYVPMQFVGFYVWSRNMNSETHTVKKGHMKNSHRLITLAAIAGATYAYGLLLSYLGDPMAYVDSFTTTASVIAMIISVKMYAEQWWIWGAVNLMSVYMWWIDFRAGSGNIATLLMWALYLVNSVVLFVQWERDIKRQNS